MTKAAQAEQRSITISNELNIIEELRKRCDTMEVLRNDIARMEKQTRYGANQADVPGRRKATK